MPKKAGLGFLQSAEQVLRKADRPMTCREIVVEAEARGYLLSSGKSPQNTLYTLLLRHIRKEGEAAKFVKTGRGKFALVNV